jgi:uncharacterized protein
MNLTLAAITVYPVKSAAGIALEEWEVDQFGLRYDRRWMVVDPSGEFITQRDHPRMALVATAITDGTLRLEAPGMAPLELPLEPQPTVHTSVRVWRDRCSATWMGERPARWFSDFLGMPCSLVHMPDETVRPANPAYAPEGTRVSFADAYPFLIISEASLVDLNRRLAEPLPMNRFRPNLVIAGSEPYAEDEWDQLEINGIGLRVVKPCERCVITTTDQATAERSQEPLRTLARYRKVRGQVMFGQNAVHSTVGRLRVGTGVLLPGAPEALID